MGNHSFFSGPRLGAERSVTLIWATVVACDAPQVRVVMSTSPFVARARAWLPFLVVGALLGGIVGLGAGLVRNERYTSTLTALVVAANATDMTEASAGQGVAQTQSQIYAALGGSQAVAQSAANTVGGTGDSLSSQVSVTSGAVVPTVTITATDQSPEKARALGQAWFKALVAESARAQTVQGDKATTQLVQVGDATTPSGPDQPTLLVLVGLLTALGGLGGLLVGLGVKRRPAEGGAPLRPTPSDSEEPPSAKRGVPGASR